MNKQNKKGSKSNQKILLIFIAILAASMVGGFVFGRLMANAEDTVTLVNLARDIKEFFVRAIPVVFVITFVLGMILSLTSFLRCHMMYKKLQNDRENDDLWDALEEKLNQPIILTNSFFMVILCLFFCCLITEKQAAYSSVVFITIFLLFVAFGVMGILIPKMTIDIEKKLNPEKQGNVLDLEFQKVWMDSCDEAQKMIAYKAGYKAFQSTNAACLILILAAFICSVAFQTDLMALIFVCVIWFVNNLSYMIRAAKLEKRK
jgi:uncharacterized membrane protein